MEPDFLWVRFMKARYFPHSSFLEAKKRGRASWAWASILEGREILLRDAHWQVMSGKDVRLWVDRWVHSLSNGHPTPLESSDINWNQNVASIIQSSSHDWDLQLISSCVSQQEMDQIREVQIGDPSSADRFIWPSEKSGMYTVKSSYHWLHSGEIPLQHRRSALLASINKKVWMCIWQLEAPPKIRMFMWRILHRALATRLDLSKRHVVVSPTCHICNKEDESVEHMLLMCPWVEPVWFGSQLNYKVNMTEIDTFQNWLFSLILTNMGSKRDKNRILSHVAFACWNIWKERCHAIFNQKTVSPLQVIHKINCAHAAYMEASKRSQHVSMGNTQSNQAQLEGVHQACSVWSTPEPSWYKVNVDANWNSITKKGYVATVIRDSNGTFIDARRQSVSASGVQEAEAKAILEGCKLAIQLELRKVIIESDSKEVVSSLYNSIYQGSWQTIPVLSQALQLKGAFQQCKWAWIPRSANLVVDRLASVKISEMNNYTWVDRPPYSIVHILNKDGLPCPH